MRYVIITFIALLAISFSFAENASAHKSDVIFLEEGEVFQGDYFSSGSTVEISGRIKGDAYIAAGQAIIDGIIEGDLLLLCGSADISGKVLGNIRALAGQVTFSGSVGKNLTALAGNVYLSPNCEVKGNSVITAANADLQGQIDHALKLSAFNARFAGKVDDDIMAYVGEIRVTSKGFIGKDFIYRSHDPAWIDDKATILGKIEYRPSIIHDLVEIPWLQGIIMGSKIITLGMNFLFSIVLGYILIKLFPQKLSKTLDLLSTKPLYCFTTGIVIVVLLPILCLVLLLTVLGAPFALALAGLNLLGFYTAKVFVIFWVASKALKKFTLSKKPLIVLSLGLCLYYLITAIPFVGAFITVLTVLLGIGGVVRAQAGDFNFSSAEKG